MFLHVIIGKNLPQSYFDAFMNLQYIVKNIEAKLKSKNLTYMMCYTPN